ASGTADRFDVRVRSDRLALDGTTRDALPPKLRAQWDTIAPGGSARLDLRCSRGQPASGPADGADGITYQAIIEPLEATACLDAFPLPLYDVNGRITIT